MDKKFNWNPDSEQWKAAMEQWRQSWPAGLGDHPFMQKALKELERDLREQSKRLVGYWVQPHSGSEEDRIGVAAFSPDHAARLVRTYVFPFVRSPEPFLITEVELDRPFFEVDIWHPELPRDTEEEVAFEGALAMPWIHPQGNEIEAVLDTLVEEGFSIIDIPGMEERYGDALFDEPGFEGRKAPTGYHKLAFVLSSPAEDISASVPWYAMKMEGPLEEEWDDDADEWAVVEPRLVVLDGPLPEKYLAYVCPHKYTVW